MSIDLPLPLNCLIWGYYLIICPFRVQKSRKISILLQLTHFVGPQTPRIEVGQRKIMIENLEKGWAFRKMRFLGEKLHLNSIFGMKCAKNVIFPIISIHLYRKTPVFHKSRYPAPPDKVQISAMVFFGHPHLWEATAKVPTTCPIGEINCHDRNLVDQTASLRF